MAEAKKPAPKAAPAKKGAKKGRWNLYEKSGEKITRKNKSCPKCGSGVRLAEHKDRRSCGKCGYFEKK